MGQRSKNRIQEKDIEDNEEMKRGGIAIRNEITGLSLTVTAQDAVQSAKLLLPQLSQYDYFGLPCLCIGKNTDILLKTYLA